MNLTSDRKDSGVPASDGKETGARVFDSKDTGARAFDSKETGARARGAIQKGETGDKVPGFDPAAAPMETDGEAGGHAWPETAQDAVPPRGKPGDSNASSHASGLRPFETDRDEAGAEKRQDSRIEDRRAHRTGWLVLLALVVAGCAVILWIWP